MKNFLTILWLPACAALLLVQGCHTGSNTPHATDDSVAVKQSDSLFESQFSPSDLITNWEKHSIPLDSVFDGGPGKNDIPAIDYPKFVSAAEAHKFLSAPDFGVFLDWNGEQKFYPLNILNWHEIVNDEIGGQPVVVTFCPLCGSGMVFSRVFGRDTLLFGVSGKLYESNLLMFDSKKESLWSQAMGECVVGDDLGTKLQLINSVLISYEDVEQYFPNAKVLSTDTGFDRNYFQYPYSDYNSSEELYFPVGKISDRYKNKDEMYVVQIGDESVAFHWLDLLKAGKATKQTKDGLVEVKVTNLVPEAINKNTGEKLNGYFSYWFSWNATYGENGIVWGK